MMSRKDAERLLRIMNQGRLPSLLYENYSGRIVPVKEIVRCEEMRINGKLEGIKLFLILGDDTWVAYRYDSHGWNRLILDEPEDKPKGKKKK